MFICGNSCTCFFFLHQYPKYSHKHTKIIQEQEKKKKKLICSKLVLSKIDNDVTTFVKSCVL